MSSSLITAEMKRQLVRPSSHIPWSVDVVRLVPKRVAELIPKVVASCAAVGWSAITTGDGYVHVWRSKTIGMSETLEPPKSCVKLFLPDLLLGDGDDRKIHLALCASSTGTGGRGGDTSGDSTGVVDAVNLYAWHAGWLYLRKLTSKDLVQSASSRATIRAHTTKTRVDLEEGGGDRKPEEVTTLTASPGLLVLGTSIGNLYWVTLTPVPVGLHVQKVAPQTGWLSRAIFGNDTSSSAGVESPCHVLPLSATEFISLSKEGGRLVRWKVTVTAGTAHHATFEPGPKNALAISPSKLYDSVILQAALAADLQSMHCVVSGTWRGETKMYWVQAGLDGKVMRTIWISRFAELLQVDVVGIITTENGSAYAAFFQPSLGSPTIMALLPDDEIIQEVDLPASSAPSLLANMLERDSMTHGCAVMTSNGLGLRVRYLPRDLPPTAKKARYSSSQGIAAPVNSTLVSHLRSSFWQAYQDPETHRPMPPSLRAASPGVLEQAIVSFATELQHKGDAASAQNPMEWHRALIKFLQERGLYRSISHEGRWQLLSIGQELSAFGFVTQFKHGMYASGSSECKSYELADWLLELQETNPLEWNVLLGGLLDTAMAYREESASPLYDLLNDVIPPRPLWLSHKSLQIVLLRQLEDWKRSPANVERLHAEPIVKAALLSYYDHHPIKGDYARVQKLGIGLLRALGPNSSNEEYPLEELAFDLSIQYNYFAGLCQMSVDHEKKRDAATFSLDPHFETITGKEILSGYSFAQFVLQWHTDNGLYGHAINYGRHAPNELALLMNKDERLRKYKWIPAIRQSYFDQATESCLGNSEWGQGSLKSTQWALSMAKLTNQLSATHNKERQQVIDRKLDLVSAQQMLQEEDIASTGEVSQQTPEELVLLALQRLPRATSLDDRVRFATIALAVCNAIEDTGASIDYTAQVWAEALRLDEAQWMTWLKTESDLTSSTLRDRMMEGTIFGALLSECRKEETMSSVTYGRHIESAVIEKIGGGVSKLEFSRLLRSVTSSPADSIQAQSLVVASY